MKKYVLISFFGLFFVFVSCADQEQSIDLNENGTIEAYEDASLTIRERVNDLIPRLSVEEKANLVVGRGFNMPGMGGPQIEEKVPGAAGSTRVIDSLGIPSIVLADGPAGLRITPIRENDSTNTYYATAFPIASMVASSWDVELAKKVGDAMGKEVKEFGVDILLAPALNIHRNPLGGRNFEYYSEDPLLAGKMTAAVVNGVESNGVGTSIKHFAANNQETNRMMINTIVGERALREIYLKGFEIAVKESQPWTVMSAYNQLNDAYASQNEELLTDVLRDDWGFEGLVMTDWFAGDNPVAQMQAGNDLLMPGSDQQVDTIVQAVENGELSEEILDRNAARVLEAVFKSPTFEGYEYSDHPDLEANAEIARQAATEGMVLLQNNEGALPLDDTSERIAAFGNTSYDFISGGTGSGDVNEAYTISLVQGLESGGYQINTALTESYNSYLEEQKANLPQQNPFMPLPTIPEMEVSDSDIQEAANNADVAFITLGRHSGELADLGVEEDFYLSEREQELIANVSEAFHAQNKKVIVILNIGSVIETVSWRDQVDGILVAWQAGQEAGNAVADVVSGKVNPSGKLPTTFSMVYEDVPSAANFPGVELAEEPDELMGGFSRGVESEVIYEEGIYVGYRYFSTFDVEPAYEFGYGLSYADFEYGPVTLSSDQFEDEITVTVEVTNAGDVAGKEVVQLYLTAPEGGLDKPAFELKAFAKTGLMEPGASQELEFTLTPDLLTSYDSSQSAWVAAAGDYEVRIGTSSEDIRQTATFSLAEEQVVAKTSKALSPSREIDELSSN